MRAGAGTCLSADGIRPFSCTYLCADEAGAGAAACFSDDKVRAGTGTLASAEHVRTGELTIRSLSFSRVCAATLGFAVGLQGAFSGNGARPTRAPSCQLLLCGPPPPTPVVLSVEAVRAIGASTVRATAAAEPVAAIAHACVVRCADEVLPKRARCWIRCSMWCPNGHTFPSVFTSLACLGLASSADAARPSGEISCDDVRAAAPT